jgi:hypothetical protein
MAAETDDGIAVNDGGAVMTYGMGIEKALQKRLADRSAQIRATAEVPVKGIVPLDDDQSTDPFAGEICNDLGNNFGRVAIRDSRRNLPPDSSQNGKTFEKSPEIFLENDDKNEDKDSKEALENTRGQVKLEIPGTHIYKSQETDTDKNEAGCPFLEPDQDSRNHDGNDGNVKDVLDSNVLKNR